VAWRDEEGLVRRSWRVEDLRKLGLVRRLVARRGGPCPAWRVEEPKPIRSMSIDEFKAVFPSEKARQIPARPACLLPSPPSTARCLATHWR
jgi:hypothetical protein